MKKIVFLSLFALPFLFFNTKAIAQIANQSDPMPEQGPCATGVPDEQWEIVFSKLIEQFKEQASTNKSQNQLYTIPVIIHVIHGGQAVGTYPNLAQAQLNSQIRVLNEDFGGIGYNAGNYPLTAFKSYADSQNILSNNLDVLGRVQIANCQVQFCLATKDTLGNNLAEPGIERINYINKGWSNPASFATINSFTGYMNGTIKPQSIWNVTKYLNIWVSDVNGQLGLLGYATFPAFSGLSGLTSSFGTPTTDGIWCYSRAFGSQGYFPSGSYSGTNNRGRTSTHEVGHWLGLRHVWGDNGQCGATDYCVDTPPQKGNAANAPAGCNYGALAYPSQPNTCTRPDGYNNSSAKNYNGDMFMNFMDYVNDVAKYMFTTDQGTRIQTTMLNSPYRSALGTHNLCSIGSIAAQSQFNLPVSVCESVTVSPVNTSYGTPVPTYTWSASGNASFSPNANTNVVIINFPSVGIYTINLAAGNGTTSISSKTIEVKASPSITITGFGQGSFVCMNDDVTLLANGASSYTWQPGSIIGISYNYIATSEQTITCTGVNSDNCSSTNNLTLSVSECVGLKNEFQNDFSFSISPNPVINELRVNLFTQNNSNSVIEILDITGKQLLRKAVEVSSNKTELFIDLHAYQSGLYFLRVSSENGASKTVKILKE